MIRLKKNPSFILLACIFLVFFVMTSLTPMLADDYSYSFSYAENGKRIQSLPDIIQSLSAHREKMNGRMISHGLAMLFLMLPKTVFNLANALNAITLLLLILRYVRSDNDRRNNCFLLLAFLLLWSFVPVFGQVFLWLDGALNYSWALSFQLAFLCPFYLEYTGQQFLLQRKLYLQILFVLLAFAAGAYSENASCAALFIAFCFTLLIVYQKRKIPFYLGLSFLFAFAGFLYMMTAPAERGRAAETDLLVIAKNIQRVFEAPRKELLPVYCLFAALLVVSLIEKADPKLVTAAVLFVLGSAVSVVVFAFAVYFPWRSLFATTVYLCVGCLLLMKAIWGKGIRYPVPILTAVLSMYFVFSFVLGLGDITVLYLESRERNRILEKASLEGTDTVCIHQYSANTKYAASYLLPDVYDDPAQWPNYDIAAYYGVGSVIGLPPIEEFGE